MIAWFPPIPVAGPMTLAAILLMVGNKLPNRVPDAIAIVASLLVAAVDAAMARQAVHGPLTYWFGGWQPRGGVVIGIGFQVDPASASLACLIAILFAAAFTFAWGFFQDIGARFQVLMLLFLAAMGGFCLTHDLFNMFVWFEVMSVVAFALTAYRLEASALEGALNFTVTNSIAAYLMLGGIGLLYARAGQLDFTAIAHALGGRPDPVVDAAFALLAVALLIKGATVPLHFWLADAHAVAPSPVSVIFSGAMVPLGVFGVARLAWYVFPDIGAVTDTVRALLVWLGVASAVIGGMMCLGQRHLKRLLAFSTISHAGIMLAGFALLSRHGLGGMLIYLAGHGLVKGALFMIAGILLAKCGGIDELELRGRGRDIWPAGIAMALGGALLGGAPIGLMDEGTRLIDRAATDAGRSWVTAGLILAASLTGGAVLRAAGRIFLDLGPAPGEEAGAPTEQEEERGNRPLWLMLLPAVVLLGIALISGASATEHADAMAGAFIRAGTGAAPAASGPAEGPHPFVGWLALGLSVMFAAYDLGRGRIMQAVSRVIDRITGPVFALLERQHSGAIGDYVAWIVGGLALAVAVLGFI